MTKNSASSGNAETNATQELATKTALVYLRVSSAQQADKDFDKEGFSIPGQREACAREAEKLGARVVDEYIDRGESAKTARRPALRAMLDRLKAGDIDYVIVHKVDRLARNRADDVEIVMAIRQAGAQLVSVSENIDETPSGLLLHGIMSSIAEFYSRNLAAEVMKGTTQKAKAGGTPFRAPIGYLHDRLMVDGREVRIVALDPERAPLVREAFNLYGTGEYSLAELAAIMEERGLRSRPTRKYPARALAAKDIHKLLRNPYYIGVIEYAGKTYEGRHEPLIDEETFESVQELMSVKRVKGEKPWRHFHYLRGSLYCGECGRRLIYTRATGKGGEYEYFVCGGRQHGKCKQRSHRVEAVEGAIERHYADKKLSDKEREKIAATLRSQADAVTLRSGEQVAASEVKLIQLDRQERKLLTAHYDDKISEELFSEEQARIRKERNAAKKRIESLSVDYDNALRQLDRALALMTEDTEIAYLLAEADQRRMLNQGFSKRFEICNEELVAEVEADPFGELRALGKCWDRPAPALKGETPASPERNGGLNIGSLVPLRGFEPRFPD
ncbi:MAG: recombinase family protein [Solirubrobacterales bacterium]